MNKVNQSWKDKSHMLCLIDGPWLEILDLCKLGKPVESRKLETSHRRVEGFTARHSRTQ